MWNHNHNYVCRKHKYNARRAGLCPTCREELECLGFIKRIGRHGNFDRIERKTRKFAGQQPIVTYGARRRAMRAKIEAKKLALAVSTDTSFVKMS